MPGLLHSTAQHAVTATATCDRSDAAGGHTATATSRQGTQAERWAGREAKAAGTPGHCSFRNTRRSVQASSKESSAPSSALQTSAPSSSRAAGPPSRLPHGGFVMTRSGASGRRQSRQFPRRSCTDGATRASTNACFASVNAPCTQAPRLPPCRTRTAGAEENSGPRRRPSRAAATRQHATHYHTACLQHVRYGPRGRLVRCEQRTRGARVLPAARSLLLRLKCGAVTGATPGECRVGSGGRGAGADACGAPRRTSCTSQPAMTPSQEREVSARASSSTPRHACSSKSCHPVSPHCRRSRPGATRCAMRAASVSSVPEPHMQSTSLPSAHHRGPAVLSRCT